MRFDSDHDNDSDTDVCSGGAFTTKISYEPLGKVLFMKRYAAQEAGERKGLRLAVPGASLYNVGMRCCKQFWSYGCLLITWVPVLAVQELDVARQAVVDQLLEVAEKEYLELSESASEDTIRYLALLELAEIQVRSGQPARAQETLRNLPRKASESIKQEATLLRAEIALARGNAEGAARLLNEVDEDAELREQRAYLQSEILFETEGIDAALEPLRTSPAYPDSVLLQLQEASLLTEAKREEEAEKILEQIVEERGLGEGGREARIRLSRILVEAEESEKAMAVLSPVLERGAGTSALELDLYPVLIQATELEEDYQQAADLLAAFSERMEDQDFTIRLHAREAVNRIAAGELTSADTLLGGWIAQFGDVPDLSAAQKRLASAWLEEGELERSRKAYDRYLSVVTDPVLRAVAQTGLASVLLALDELDEAAMQAEQALQILEPPSRPHAEALFLLADTELGKGNPERAAEVFSQWLDLYPDHPDRTSVLLRSSEAFTGAGLQTRVTEVLDEVRRLDTQSPLAETALLQKAMLLGPRRVEQALGAFDAYLEAYPEGVYVADAMTEKGIAAYRLGLFDLAIREFFQVQQQFPDHPRVEQAFCLRGWAHYLKGEDAEAQRIGEAFLETYPESTFAPDVRLWLAEMSYNRGDYVQSASEFRALAELEVEPEVQARAAYLAGRSLLANKRLEQALNWLEKSLSLAPDSPVAPEALFYTGDALTELDRFDEAIVKFDQVIREHPEHYLVPAARGRIGDCQYTLGEENPGRYEEALNTYREVMESADTPLELKLQATYKTGRALAALGRQDEALDLFLKASTSYRANLGRLPSSARLWFVRSVTDAAQYLESQEEFREAIRVYRQLASTSVEGAAEASRRIEDLRREHLILF